MATPAPAATHASDPRDSAGVLIADDHALARRLAAAALAARPDLHVLAEAADGEAAVALAARLRPDVVVLDLTMPRLDGLGAAAAIRAGAPDVAIVIFSAVEPARAEARALAVGADAYVPKDAGIPALVAAVAALAGR